MNARAIRPLPESVINQIAAGEVIERPASIVKELVENALDAGAGSIDIELDDGGIARVQIRDDGDGIAPAQLPLALTRHCTSKITTADDLPTLVTLGFRGEALAAIGSVADLTIISRTADAAHGWRIAQRASALPGATEPSPHPRGTTVIVRDLFAQVPARRRFLKRAQTEGLHVLNLLRRIAFCTPAVAFTVTLDGQRSLQLPATSDDQSAERRRRALFGAEFSADAHYVDIDRDGVRVAGWVAGPALAHAQADLQMLAVNGRVIRDRRLAHAVRTAFDERLPAGRFPCFALHLEMAPDAVDVNVHPGKIEVRFHDLRTVHDVLHTAVREALALPGPTPALSRRSPTTAVQPLRTAEVREERPALIDAPAPRTAASDGPLPALLQIVAQRYAVVADDTGLALVDLRGLVAATLRARLAPHGPTRPLVIPIRVDCVDEAAALACAQTLRAAGLALNMIGPRTLALRALPVAVPAVDPMRFGAALAVGGEADAEALLAQAAARAVQPPPRAEQARWLAQLVATAVAAGVAPAHYERRLDEASLGHLFGTGDGLAS